MKLYLYNKYDITTGMRQDDGDGTEWSGFNHEVRFDYEFFFSKNNKSFNYWYFEQEFQANPNKPIYLLYILYSTGGTFNRTDGYCHIQDVGNDYEKLNELNKKIDKDPLNCGLSYMPWKGYFEQFEYVDLIRIYEK